MAKLEVNPDNISIRGTVRIWRKGNRICFAIDGVDQVFNFKPEPENRHFETLDEALSALGK
jgi:hypothetical protein